MEYLGEPTQGSQGKILCCQCGVPIPPNAANTCVSCLRTQVDITEGIPKQGSVYFCKQCERYLQPPGTWVHCALESRELLALCLKKLKGPLSKVRLIDAGFIWTEPHSKRIRVKLTIQKEVMNGVVLQQVFVLELIVSHQMCDDCHRVEAKDFWKAVVQLRQKASHKKTFYYLEQLILKHRMHQHTLNIKEVHGGLDFYFGSKQEARKMVEFFNTVVPCRFKTSERLISHDVHSNTYNCKSAYSVEIVPVCKGDVVYLSPALARSLGNLGQVCVCARVTSAIHLIDPSTLQVAEVSGAVFWREPFSALSTPRSFTSFIVLDVEPLRDQRRTAGSGATSSRHVLAEVWLQRWNEVGTGEQLHTRTHLGHLLKPGDRVLGLDLSCANVGDVEGAVGSSPGSSPSVVLVRKAYERSRRARRRNWTLAELPRERQDDVASDDERQYEDFLEDLEEDEAVRKNVNIYRDRSHVEATAGGGGGDEEEEDDAPRIGLDEMMEDLKLTDAPGGPASDMVSE
uniref:60S ribosomal export protein NMD3 n=1 Tax=Petromyzon marinus TaxID=7757 RepID=A0AAJ7UDK3_PETMA|nr:60S ribosomal export protein NMD3 [Petromyzon marinus]